MVCPKVLRQLSTDAHMRTLRGHHLTQVLSGEMRFSPDKAYPEKFGAEAPEQPQTTTRVKKVGFSPSTLAPADGANMPVGIELPPGIWRTTALPLRHCGAVRIPKII